MFTHMPITWCLGSDDATLAEAAHASFEAWEELAPCAGVDFEFEEACREDTDIRVELDEEDVIGEGALATVTAGAITVNDVDDWATREEIEAGTCVGEASLDTFLLHTIGDLLGVPHSCDEGEECNAEEQAAVMYWSQPPCELKELTDHDRDALTSAYGYPFVVETPDGDGPAAVDEELCFSVEADEAESAALLDVTWDFGDGTAGEGLDACHAWAAAGTYAVTATVSSEDCDGVVDVAQVTVCAAPHTVTAGGPLFSYTDLDATRFQLHNHADATLAACIDTLQWDVFDESGARVLSLGSWEPTLTLSEPGEYRVVLNLGGPGGLVAEEAALTVGGAASCGGTRSFVGLPFLLLAGLRRRR